MMHPDRSLAFPLCLQSLRYRLAPSLPLELALFATPRRIASIRAGARGVPLRRR